ncbi:hypothetical protein CLOM_g3695 [Closterium sp. NIES-68]|nr:hypothetical protein CLOM_g3695 [Closterium sp. NIES-68]
MLRSFPLLASLHLPFLSHIGAGSTQDGIEPECHYIDAVCRLVASCCRPSAIVTSNSAGDFKAAERANTRY